MIIIVHHLIDPSGWCVYIHFTSFFDRSKNHRAFIGVGGATTRFDDTKNLVRGQAPAGVPRQVEVLASTVF
jgi:hypothetical protein